MNNRATRVFEGLACSLPKAVVQLWASEFPTASSAKKRIRKGLFSLNGDGQPAKCGTSVQPGDAVHYKAQRGAARQQMSVHLVVAYMDPVLVVAVKPFGVSVSNEKGAGTKSSSLHQRLFFALPDSTSSFPLRRPAAVHRLDKMTFGLVLCARTSPAARALGAAFATGTVQKRYRAIVHGAMDAPHGHIREALDGKECLSGWRVVRTYTIGSIKLTLLDLIPHTGRYHQLRRHLARIRKPIVGDLRHGMDAKDAALRATYTCEELALMLAAVELTFPHPDPAQVAMDRNGDTFETSTDDAGVHQPVLQLQEARCRKTLEIDERATCRFDEKAKTINVFVDMPSEMVGLLDAGTNSDNAQELVSH
jgi:23S rRNA-/tRNA-specific pseudouridylate synthase